MTEARYNLTAAPVPFYLERWLNRPTILLGAGVNLFTADTITSSGEGQHLDAVVGIFLQSIQLQWGLRGCHVPDLSELWPTENRRRWERRQSVNKSAWDLHISVSAKIFSPSPQEMIHFWHVELFALLCLTGSTGKNETENITHIISV